MNNNYDKSKILFLWLNENEFHAINAKKRGVSVKQIYKKNIYFLRILRRLHIELKIPLVNLWFQSWKKELNSYEVVIVHASKITPPVIKFINKKNPNIRIILWYWNPVDKSVRFEKFNADNIEIWTFDKSDAKKYNLNYNNQYYFKDIKLTIECQKYDVIFIGGDKKRVNQLLVLKDILDEMNISTIQEAFEKLKQYA
jgi:hypothetical protein